MSLTAAEQVGREVHFPADPNKFQFDGEVSDIFPSMAKRAIPLFYEMHDLHANMLVKSKVATAERPLRVLDIGASRGAFINAIRTSLVRERLQGENHIDATLLDASADMCEYLRKDFPKARVEQLDVSSNAWVEFIMSLEGQDTFDAVNMTYVLQFIRPELQEDTLRCALQLVRPGGWFFYGHKEEDSTSMGKALHDQYIRFRKDNGYSQDEIRAKSQALANSMWPLTRQAFLSVLQEGAEFDTRETLRYTVFAAYAARRLEDR